MIPLPIEQLGYAYLGKYRALVRDVNDPEKRGRIRVFCPAVMGNNDIPDNWLSWALPCFHPNAFSLPKKDDPVWVEFENGNPDFPIWVGCWVGEKDLPEAAKSGYPKDVVLRTEQAKADLTVGTKDGHMNVLGKQVNLGADDGSPATEAVILGNTYKTKEKSLHDELSKQLGDVAAQLGELAIQLGLIGTAVTAAGGSLTGAGPATLLPPAGAAISAAGGSLTGAGATLSGLAVEAATAAGVAAGKAALALSSFNQDYLSKIVFTK